MSAGGEFQAEMLVAQLPEPNNDNFIQWSWGLRRAMMFTDIWSQIFAPDANGNRPRVPPADDPNIYYTKNAKRACVLISGAAGAKNSRITDPFLDTCDPLGMLDAITNKYSTKTASTRFKVLLKMMAIRKDSSEDWEATCERIDEALANVTRLVPPNTTADQILSEFALYVLLNCIDGGDATRRCRGAAWGVKGRKEGEGNGSLERVEIRNDVG